MLYMPMFSCIMLDHRMEATQAAQQLAMLSPRNTASRHDRTAIMDRFSLESQCSSVSVGPTSSAAASPSHTSPRTRDLGHLGPSPRGRSEAPRTEESSQHSVTAEPPSTSSAQPDIPTDSLSPNPDSTSRQAHAPTAFGNPLAPTASSLRFPTLRFQSYESHDDGPTLEELARPDPPEQFEQPEPAAAPSSAPSASPPAEVQAKLYTIDERLAKFQAMLLDLQARQRKEHSPGPPPSRHPQTSSFRQRGEQSAQSARTSSLQHVSRRDSQAQPQDAPAQQQQASISAATEAVPSGRGRRLSASGGASRGRQQGPSSRGGYAALQAAQKMLYITDLGEATAAFDSLDRQSAAMMRHIIRTGSPGVVPPPGELQKGGGHATVL
jgi:hypothetical protein